MENIKNKLPLFVIPIIVLILYLPNLNDFFLSDDFVYLFYANFFKVWTNPLLNSNPFATIIFGVQFSIFKFDPLGYHLINIVLHSFNSFLVFFIINKLTNNEKMSLFGSLLFATFPIFSEPLIWISGQFDLWMTAFILLSFFSYLKFRNEKKKIWYLFSVIYFTCAILIRMIAAIFFVIYFIYDALFDENFNNLIQDDILLSEKVKRIGFYWIKYLSFIIIAVCCYIFFLMNNIININSSAYTKFANLLDFIPNSFFPIFLDNSDLYMVFFTISFFILILSFFYVYYKYQNKMLMFSISWILILIIGFTIINLSGIEIYFYLAIFNLNAVPQGRFMYIIDVGVVIFFSIILNSLYEKKFKLKWKIPTSRNMVFFSFIIFLLMGNSLLIYSQQASWKRSSSITANILIKTFATVPIGTRNVKLYYINVPDHINYPYSPNWPTAYIFRNGLQEMIRIFYPDGVINCYNMFWHKKILDFEMSDLRIPIGLNEFNQLSNDSSNIIFYFNPVTELLINVSGLNYTDFDPYPYFGIPKFEYWFN
ncbi:MAG: ArnT family glycosyltransferase [Candidatus Helarchaeota archaeon]